MSYWTYSDLFEEPGPPTATFQGGFGLMTLEGIRKPAWFAYKYLHALKGNEIPAADRQTWATADGNSVGAIVWDFVQPVQTVSNRPFYSKLVPNAPAAPVEITVRHLKPGHYRVKLYRTGYRANDAYSAYIDMGRPRQLSAAQVDQLQALTRDLPESDRTVTADPSGHIATAIAMHGNDVVLVKAVPVK